jgi:hypothetical protein
MSLPSSETLRAGFPGPNSGQMDSDIGMRSWQGQASQSAADRPALILEDRIPTAGVSLSNLSLIINE